MYASSKGDGEVITLLHGFCESHHIWDFIQHELSTNFKVISLDLPGFGDSPSISGDFSLESIADDVYLFLKQRDIHRSSLVGHSMGGYISLIIAQKYPDFVGNLVLLHSSPYADDAIKRNTRNKTIEFISEKGLDRFVDGFFSNLFHEGNLQKPSIQEALSKISNRAKLLKKNTVLRYISTMRDRAGSEEWLANYEKRVLLISGTHDALIPIESSREQRKLLKNGEYVELQQTGHMGMYESPDTTLMAIREFMTGITRTF